MYLLYLVSRLSICLNPAALTIHYDKQADTQGTELQKLVIINHLAARIALIIGWNIAILTALALGIRVFTQANRDSLSNDEIY